MPIYSQCGEQEILVNIFDKIGLKTGTSIEFGASDGYTYSNTRWLNDITHCGIFLDGNPRGGDVNKEFITAENINEIFEKYYPARHSDLLSIDIDGNDYWVWKALKHKPRVVVIEFNKALGNKSVTIPYHPLFQHDGKTIYYGASFNALKKLAQEKGYTLVNCTDLNMIFVGNEDCIESIINKNMAFSHTPGFAPAPKDSKWIEV